MSRYDAGRSLSMPDLPWVITSLFDRGRRPLVPGAPGPLHLRLRYLRRKPGRGLVVTYQVGLRRSGHLSRWARFAPTGLVSLALDEPALDGSRIHITKDQVAGALVEVEASGTLRVRDLGLVVQAFPQDGNLSTLAACCDTVEAGPVFPALQAAARAQLRDDAWHLVGARVEPVRYKPGSRCVMRYHLTLTQARHGSDEPRSRQLTLFGKVYADVAQAAAVYQNLERLYCETLTVPGQVLPSPLVPCPLGIVPALALVLSEAVGEDARQDEHMAALSGDQPLRLGPPRASHPLKPGLIRGPAGVTSLAVPGEELRLAAAALARLHMSTVSVGAGQLSIGPAEAQRARDRAVLLATYYPQQGAALLSLVEELARRLSAQPPDGLLPVHGCFKPSQLLFRCGRVFMFDFDGFALADPALDIGCFLAYLRPSRVWWQPSLLRPWFEAAAAIFVRTYYEAMLGLGMPEDAVDGVLHRARLYEASRLIKIATRRVHRLNSPRPHEVSGICTAIAECLSQEMKRK